MDTEYTKIRLSEEELANLMVESASYFVEFYSQDEFNYYRRAGYNGKEPIRFHPGVADKLIFRKLMEKAVKEIPSNFRNNANIGPFAQRVLFNDYYPIYYNPKS